MFLIRKPSVLFDFLEMRFMCVSHDRSDETGIRSDEDPFTMTDWWRLLRNPLTHLRAGPLIP